MSQILFQDKLICKNGFFLKKISHHDATTLFKVVQSNMEYFSKFDFIAPQFDSLENTHYKIDILLDRELNGTGVSYLVYEQDRLLGQFTLNRINWEKSWATIGYWLCKDAGGKGIAFSALSCLVEYCMELLKLKKLIATTAVSNLASQRLLEKVGFIQSNLIKNALVIRGHNIDDFEYALQ